MKMKISDRILLRLGGFVTLLTGAASIAAAFVLIKYCTYEHKLLKLLPYVLIGLGVFSCFDAIFDMLLPRRYHRRRNAFVTQTTDHGELRIAVSAIENLVLRCVETHREVKVLAIHINNHRGAVHVDLHVAMSSNISIPHTVDQMQMQIKRYLMASSGIDLRGVSVSVERAEGSETLPAEGMSVAETAAAAAAHVETEEVSMHQRVFGRDTSKSVAEQVTEAEMVEPEAEQETEEPAEEAQAEEIAALPEAGAEETAAQEEAPAAENTEEQA